MLRVFTKATAVTEQLEEVEKKKEPMNVTAMEIETVVMDRKPEKATVV